MNVEDIADTRELTKINHFVVARFFSVKSILNRTIALCELKTLFILLLKIKPYKHVRQTVNETRLPSQISSFFFTFVCSAGSAMRKKNSPFRSRKGNFGAIFHSRCNYHESVDT